MRKIAANLIYPVTSPPIKNGILVLDKDNVIIDIIDPSKHFKEVAGCEFYNGVLVPGFINAHCHLEFSYMHGKLEPGLGMRNFLRAMISKMKVTAEEILYRIDHADRFMAKTGTVAVGDISSNDSTLRTKRRSMIYYHTFIEVLEFDKANIEGRLTRALNLKEKFSSYDLPTTITLHAPYSVNHELVQKVVEIPDNNLLSFHTLESSLDNEKLTDNPESFSSLFHEMGLKTIPHQKEHPYQYMLAPFKNRKILLVHNLHAFPADWKLLDEIAKKNSLQVFLVTCPRSNLFIHNTIPDYSHWPQNYPICIGTDSSGSNWNLSLLHEIMFLLLNTELTFEQILPWATINGARALGIERKYGSFEIGKSPGVNLITGFDLRKCSVGQSSRAIRIV